VNHVQQFKFIVESQKNKSAYYLHTICILAFGDQYLQ